MTRGVVQLARVPPPVMAEVLPHRCRMDCVCRMDNATCPEANLAEADSGSPYATLCHKNHRREYEPFIENVSAQQRCRERNAYIVAFFLTNLARLTFNALPGVGTHKIGNGAKVHASWMTWGTSAKLEYYQCKNQPLRPHSSQETISSGSPILFFLSFPPQKPQFGSLRTLLFFFCGLGVRTASLTVGKYSGGGG